MTEPPAISPAAAALPLNARPETFWIVVLRRLRYVVAVAVSAVIFGTVGLMLVAPPAEAGGVSLLGWQGQSPLLATALIALLLIGVTALCALICHPDSPHQGLWCALLGMLAMSIRGGPIYFLIRAAQGGVMDPVSGISAAGAAHYQAVMRNLAIECIHWGVIFLVAETFARYLHEKLLTNTRWITRINNRAGLESLRQHGADAPKTPLGVGKSISGSLRTAHLAGPIGMIAATIVTVAVASLCLAALLQSQEKGQMIMACFIAFMIAAAVGYLIFPRVPALVFFVAVPITAAIGYLIAAHFPGSYPGRSGLFFARALPMDYIAAGVPGAITGFYGAFHWSLHSHEA